MGGRRRRWLCGTIAVEAAPRRWSPRGGEVAARIVEAAKRTGIEVVEDPDLLELLARVPVGREIPTELYQAVAEVLAFVYRVNGRYRQETASTDAAGTPAATANAASSPQINADERG